jgi:TonB family protein
VISLVLALAVASPQVPPAPPAPPTPRPPALVEFEPGPVRCGDSVISATVAPRPLPGVAYANGDGGDSSFTIAFRIDASGRPLSIGDPVIMKTDTASGTRYVATGDLVPTLAAWRFAPGSARSDCSIDFVARMQTVADAPIAQLRRYMALPRDSNLAFDAARRRIAEAEGECFTDMPAVRMRAYPDFAAIPQPSGTMAYTAVGFDIDKTGRPVKVRTLSSDGNAALDRASVDAVRRSRFVPGARTGCSYPYYRRQNMPMPAPTAPDRLTLTPAGANCDSHADWVNYPKLTYPAAFRRRAIEGWALIGYDVAPWGGTGNVRVLRSEPAAFFGATARGIVERAKRAPSATGATGCVELVSFKMSEDNADAAADAGTPPSPPPVR